MKKMYNRIKEISLWAVIIIWILLILTKKLGVGFYAISVILLWALLFVIPIQEYVKDRNKGKYSDFKIAIIVFGGALSLILSFALHAVVFSDNIRNNHNYEFYSQAVLVTIFYFGAVYIYEMFRQVKNQSDENRSFTKTAGIGSKYLLGFLLSFILPFYQFYEPKYEISPSNLKVPIQLEAEVISGPVTMNNIFQHRPSKLIADKDLIEELIAEIRNMKLYNIRNLDKINYDIMKERNFPYLVVYTYYDPDFNGLPGRIEDGYFFSMEIYNNGQIVLESFNDKESFLKNNRSQYFRIPLSGGMQNKLSEAFKNLKLE